MSGTGHRTGLPLLRKVHAAFSGTLKPFARCSMRSKFRQADREALITLALYLFFFLWWALFAFGLGAGDPEKYSFVLGMPAWFFFSCVLGYPLITLLLWWAVRRWFKDIPLDGEGKRGGEERQ